MPITPPKARRTGMFGRRLLTVFDVSCPPAEAVARCIDFWRPIGTEEDSPALSEQFANRGWSGTELTVVTKKSRNQEEWAAGLLGVRPTRPFGCCFSWLGARSTGRVSHVACGARAF